MNIVWLSFAFQNGELIWPMQGRGLRNQISLAGSFSGILNDPDIVAATQPNGCSGWLSGLGQ